jgi:hypothetical protein
MQASCLYVIIAKDVTTDADDHMNSIIKVIDNFKIQADKDAIEEIAKKDDNQTTYPVSYAVATSWLLNQSSKAKGTSVKFKLFIRDANGHETPGPIHNYDIPANIDRINLNFNIQGLPLLKAGIYYLTVRLIATGDKTIAEGSFPFKIELVPNKTN